MKVLLNCIQFKPHNNSYFIDKLSYGERTLAVVLGNTGQVIFSLSHCAAGQTQ